MSLVIEPMGGTIGGRVTGVDMRRPLDAGEVAAIEAGMDRYAVLVFPGQDITDEQQKAFSVNFGPLEDTAGGNVTKKEQARLGAGWRMCPTWTRTASRWP